MCRCAAGVIAAVCCWVPAASHAQAYPAKPIRFLVLSGVPTLDEAGLKGFDSVACNGVLAPAGTPKEIIAKLNTEIVRILNLPDVRERLSSQGADTVGSTPEQFAAWIRSEVQKWAKVVKDSGASVD